MSDTTTVKAGPKKTVSKNKAIAIMVTGGILFVLSIVIPTQQGTTAQYIKIIAGALGLCVLCLGAYLRPMNKPAEKE